MFSLVQRFPSFRKLTVVIFTIPLMFAGGSFLGSLVFDQNVGHVEELEIPRSEFITRARSALERYRQATGSEEVTQQVVEEIARRTQGELLSSYLLIASVQKKGIHAPDAAVAEQIRRVPDFHDEDGEFSAALYKEYVHDTRDYQRRVRESVSREPVLRALQIFPNVHIRDQIAALRRQERVIDETTVPISALTTVTVNVLQEDINLYYQRNISDFTIREAATFQYFVVSLDAYVARQTVTEDDVNDAYDDYLADSDALKRWRVSHIYLDDERQAEEIYQQASAAPDTFAELARTHSQDSGSAVGGGDLGIVADGDLPPAMNEVVVDMTVGEVRSPLVVDDGYSILKLDEVIQDTVLPLEEIEDDIRLRARRLLAADAVEEKVDEIKELTEVEIGSLDGAAAALSVSLQVAGTVYRDSPDKNVHPFNEEGVLVDAFDSFVVSDGENSPPIPLSNGDYIFVRSLNHRPGGQQPVEQVSPGIIAILQAQQTIDDISNGILAERQRDTDTDTDTDTDADADADTAVVSATVAADGDTDTPVVATPSPAPVDSSILDSLAKIDWQATHTVVLGEGEETVNAAAGDEVAGLSGADGDSGLGNEALDRIYVADLTYGLPAYVFEPLETGVRIFRIREVRQQEPLLDDYEVADNMLEEMAFRLSNLGYLDELSSQYNFEFYDELPDLGGEIIGPQQ